MKPKILLTGKFQPDDLDVSVSESTRKVDLNIENQLESIWQKQVKHAKDKDLTLYNGTSYRLNSIQESKGKVKLDFGTLEYKVRDGLIDISEYFDLPEEYYRKGCFTSASIKTSDNHYLMVELSGKSMNKYKIDIIGGIMETNVGMNTGYDIFKSLYNEMEEEAGIIKREIKDSYLQTIYLTDRTNIGFYFEVVLSVSSAELLERFKENNDKDIKSLCVYTREEYINKLRNHNSLNKKLIATILQI